MLDEVASILDDDWHLIARGMGVWFQRPQPLRVEKTNLNLFFSILKALGYFSVDNPFVWLIVFTLQGLKKC